MCSFSGPQGNDGFQIENGSCSLHPSQITYPYHKMLTEMIQKVRLLLSSLMV